MEDGSTNLAVATLISALFAAGAPIISLIVTSRMKRLEKAQDYARQDAVANRLLDAQTKTTEQAAKDAKLLLDAQTKTTEQAAKDAKLLLTAQAKTNEHNAETQGKLNQIHTLVNSNLTREMHDRLVALKGQVHLTKELIRLSKLNNLEPGDDTTSSLVNLEMAVSHLETALKERGNATQRADNEQT